MKRVVLIGFDPAAVDYSDPALPPGMTAEKIHAGVKLALADFARRPLVAIARRATGPQGRWRPGKAGDTGRPCRGPR